MTVRNYFTKHPKFNASGNIERAEDGLIVYCGVPINEEIYNAIRVGDYDWEISERSLAELRSK